MSEIKKLRALGIVKQYGDLYRRWLCTKREAWFYRAARKRLVTLALLQ